MPIQVAVPLDARPRAPLRPWVTGLCAAMMLVLVAYLFVMPRGDNKLDSLRFPAESAGRMLDRHLEFYEGYERTAPWEQALFRMLFGDQRHVQSEAVGIYREILTYFHDQPEDATPWASLNTRARLLVTLAETGEYDALRRELETMDGSLDEEVLREAIRFAYSVGETDAGANEILYGARLLPLGWAADRLQMRISERMGYDRSRALASDKLVEHGARWRSRVLWLAAAVAGVMLGGALVWSRRRQWLQQPPGWRSSALDGSWGTAAGFGVVVRAGLLGLLISVGASVLGGSYFQPGVWALWTSLLASLPMLWLIRRHLLQPLGLGFSRAFGLTLRGVGAAQFVRITLAVLALEWAGSLLIAWLGWTFGWQSHWSEGMYERVIFGPWQTALLSSVNVVLWAPIFEEIGFRGLIFGTLRSRFAPWVAMVLSALLFSALHLYSLTGFLAVFWSGLVLAWAYHRFGSLLPGMVVHAAGNLLAMSTVLLFYR